MDKPPIYMRLVFLYTRYMTNEIILHKVIEKAGWDWGEGIVEDTIKMNNYYRYIFSHQFAKAFWHSEDRNNWKWHLQEMVVREEPIKYLEKFL